MRFLFMVSEGGVVLLSFNESVGPCLKVILLRGR